MSHWLNCSASRLSLFTSRIWLPSVYPAHGAGSLCGRSLSVEPFSTIGEQRKYNYALQPMSEEEFVSLVTLDQPAAPDYFLHDAIMNRKEHQILSASLVHALKPLGVREVLR